MLAGIDGKPCQVYDSRIHADFVQYGARTGRFSCRAPNLQNIPRGDTEHGKMLRDAWIADPDGCLVVADYGQIELVMLAHFIGEGALFDGFWQGIDPHTMTAALVFGVAPGDVAATGPGGRGDQLRCGLRRGSGQGRSHDGQSPGRAKEILADHQDAFPEIYAYKDAVLRKAARDGGLYTLLGRKRRIPELRSRDNGTRMYAERQAFNSKMQGSAADLIKLAMGRTHKNLKGIPGSYISLTVHDELILRRAEEPGRGYSRRFPRGRDRQGNPETR